MNKVTDLGNKNWVVWLGIVSSIIGIITFIFGKNLPDFFGPKDASLTSTPFIEAIRTTSPTSMATNTLISVSTLPATQEPHFNLTGIWDLSFDYKGYTNSKGVFKERISTEAWEVNLLQSGDNITGELLSVNSKYVDSCINAKIDGTINDNKITLFIRFNGSCCPDEIARIDGSINRNTIIIGQYQPAKTPSGTCTLSTGDVIGTKH